MKNEHSIVKPTSNLLTPLTPNTTDPFYRQIYERFRSAIATGVLKPGDRVPSARALAKDLGLARGTIETAYSLLSAEGYIRARGQAGTIITPDLRVEQLMSKPVPLSQSRPETTDINPESILPFQMGLPALDGFPRKIWARLGARTLRAMQPSDMVKPPSLGSLALRTQIAAYLQVSRGIVCAPSQIFLTSGYSQTIELVAHALLKAGDRVLLEDPGYPPTRAILTQMGIEGVPVPVDNDGIIVSEGLSAAPWARAAVVTPAHQSPLCVSLSLPRRQMLLDWANKNASWIIEDDYDGEYRYISRPLPALKSIDHQGRVLYAGTFSKVLFPGIRLAYLVVPTLLVPQFQQITEIFGGGIPELTQSIVTDFIAEGHFSRHIQRMRSLYGERRQHTAAGLERVLGGRMKIDAQPGGMHLILRLNNGQSDRELASRMLANGLYAEALSNWLVLPEDISALLLSFTNIDSQRNAEILGGRILQLM